MCPRLLHIYGPLWINGYGTMLAVGFAIFMYLLFNDKRTNKLISTETLSNTLFLSVIIGIVGGRISAVLENFDLFEENIWEIFFPWIGGLGILGSIIGILLFLPFYLRLKNVQILPLLDLAAIYAPIIQAIGRIGCFLAGCCYGLPVSSNYIFAIKFTNPNGLAPLNIYLHPTQIYISVASLIIFLIMYFGLQKILFKQGQLLFSYLILESCSRFFIDFFRGDRTFSSTIGFFSFFQLIAIFLFIFSIIGLIYVTIKSKKTFNVKVHKK